MTLGVGRYKVEIAHAGVGDERGDVILDVTPWVSSIKWAWSKSSISLFQVSLQSHDCAARLAKVRTVFSELRITRNGVIVCEGPLTRKETTDSDVRLVGSDLLWWLQRRFLAGKARSAKADLAEIVQLIFDDSVGRTDLFADTMDPGLAGFLTLTPVGVTGSFGVEEADLRMAFEELSAWARAGMDFTVVRRSTLVAPSSRDDAITVGGFGSIARTHILGEPKLIERGDLYLTDYVAIGGDGILIATASVEDVIPGSEVAPHLRAYARGYHSTVYDQDTLQSIADTEVRHRFPSPVEISMGSAAWLSPSCPITLDRLIPTAEGTIDPGAGYPIQPVRISKVEGRVNSDGEEKISLGTEPLTTLL